MKLAHNLIALSLLTVVAGCGGDDSTAAGGGPLTGGSPGGSGQVDGGGGGGVVGGPGGPGGTTGGSSPGGGATPGGGGTPSGNVCEARTIDAFGSAPDMLIVMDRSLSMQLYGRWDPSKTAVKTLTRDFEGLMGFGLSLFPGDGGTCSPGKLDVPLMTRNAAPIATALDRTNPNGFTPTGPALQEALKILGDRNSGLDGATAKAGYVLLVTDGEPSCAAIPGLVDQAQRDAAKAAVQALKAANIPTYVIGYQIDPNFQPLMNELAQLGGTMMYRPAESADQVVETFRQITKDVVKCSFDLAEVPPDPRFVRVEIDMKTVELNAADGWVIEGKTVTLQGGSCGMLKDGRGHLLNAQVECQIVELK